MMKRPTPMKQINKKLLSIAASVLLASSMQADCTYELFTIASAKGTTIGEYIDQLTDECGYSVIISDKQAEELLKKRLHRTNIKNLTIDEVLSILLTENNLDFSIENNILKISYVTTKTYNIDYIITSRKSSGNTDVTLSSTNTASATDQGGLSSSASSSSASGQNGGAAATNQSGIKIESTDEVLFWEELDLELQRVLNRPEDTYEAEAPIINKNGGLITVSATAKQHERLKNYLEQLQNRVTYQVMIDVHLLGVIFDDTSSTGIDWSQIYALQNLDVSLDHLSYNNVSEFENGQITEAFYGAGHDIASLVKISGQASLKEVIKFLKAQGEVRAISNPKVLTLNNQPALISVGTEFFYKIQQSANLQGGGGSGVVSTTQNELVNSVFAGVLLDITPEISEDETITLKINPSVSQTRVSIASDEESQKSRDMPPDLDRRQLSSVVTVKDGNRIILGGLIGNREDFKTNKVPLLGDVPGLGYLFKYEEKIRQIEELVIVIEPHIIKKEGNTLTLADLGYTGLDEEDAALKATFSDKNSTLVQPAVSKEANE
jgi:general secretion pathway protein D